MDRFMSWRLRGAWVVALTGAVLSEGVSSAQAPAPTPVPPPAAPQPMAAPPAAPVPSQPVASPPSAPVPSQPAASAPSEQPGAAGGEVERAVCLRRFWLAERRKPAA